jgi:thiol-disulfide isomerase/thioredoxin
MRQIYRQLTVAAGLMIAGACATTPVGGVAQGQEEKKVEASAAGTAAGTKRTSEQIRADLDVATRKLREALPSPMDLYEEEKRKALAPKVLPPMKAIVAGYEELMEVDPGVRGFLATTRMQFLTTLSLLGDEESAAKLAKMAQSADVEEATTAKGRRLIVRWWKNAKNAAEQSKVLDETRALAQAQPQSDDLAMTVMAMAQQHAATPELQRRAQQILMEDLKSESAKELAEDLAAKQRLAALEGKPLTLEGVKHDGGKFSTADWKGKVVLVDFWATWCVPCVAEMPRLKKAYAEHHEQGLEIVGVSCNNELEHLTAFLARNKDMPWPQLFEKTAAGDLPSLATGHGVTKLPTMFLIDRKGVVRSVKGQDDFEELIPKLLEEKGE